MTSRRDSTTSIRGLRFIGVAILAAVLGACAALPDDAPVVEQLDTETGTTVTRLGRPIELYRETFLSESSGRFAFIGPFETNRMGQRESFVWVAVPVEPSQDALPVIELDGAVLTLGTPGRSPDFADLHTSPYKIPTPWSAMYYFKADQAALERLAAASHVAVRMAESGKNGTVQTLFAATVSADARLKDFASH